jgi:hypothetical protein
MAAGSLSVSRRRRSQVIPPVENGGDVLSGYAVEVQMMAAGEYTPRRRAAGRCGTGRGASGGGYRASVVGGVSDNGTVAGRALAASPAFPQRSRRLTSRVLACPEG